jgi:hypothetical protein
VHITFSCENLNKRDNLEDLASQENVKNSKLDHKEAGYNNMIWIHLAQNINHRPNLVNTVNILRVP